MIPVRKKLIYDDMGTEKKQSSVSGIYGFPYVNAPSLPGTYSVCVHADWLATGKWLLQGHILVDYDLTTPSRALGSSLFVRGERYKDTPFASKRELFLQAEWTGSSWIYRGKELSILAWAFHTSKQVMALIRPPKDMNVSLFGSLLGNGSFPVLTMQMNGCLVFSYVLEAILIG